MNNMRLPTQQEVEKCSEKIKKDIAKDNKIQFLCENCIILNEKMSVNITKIDKRILKESKDHYGYCPPEGIDEYLNRVCFYLALKELGVEKELWL
jgi:hypothetical protein